MILLHEYLLLYYSATCHVVNVYIYCRVQALISLHLKVLTLTKFLKKVNILFLFLLYIYITTLSHVCKNWNNNTWDE